MKRITRLVLAALLLAALAAATALAGEAPRLWIDGERAEDGRTLVVSPGDADAPVTLSWSAEGATAWSVQVTRDDGRTIVSMAGITDAELPLAQDALEAGAEYDVEVGAVFEAGGDTLWSRGRFRFDPPEGILREGDSEGAGESDPAAVAGVSAPEIFIDGEPAGDEPVEVADRQGAGSFEVSWRAEGAVAGYCVQITDADGRTLVSMADIPDTSIPVAFASLTPGLACTVEVGAIPEGGERGDALWSEARFVPAEGGASP